MAAMKRIFTYQIEANEHGWSVKHFLEAKGYSHAVIVLLKRTEYGITINGNWCYINDTLSSGDLLQVTLLETAENEHIVPSALPFGILYEDDDILLANKPADMPVHPSLNNYSNTLANAVTYHWKESGISCPFRCINRLDRDTTGLVLIAKHALSGAILSRQMMQRAIHRTYLAIAEGETPLSGKISAPIARKEFSAIERTVDFETGEPAVTNYIRIAAHNGLSLLALQLETGRTHQIRVHMKYIGHPLIGDFLYHPDLSQIRRQALHSWRLTFSHPITNENCCFYAMLPEDMARLFPDITEEYLESKIPDSFGL